MNNKLLTKFLEAKQGQDISEAINEFIEEDYNEYNDLISRELIDVKIIGAHQALIIYKEDITYNEF